MRFHSSVLGCCLICLMGQIYPVPLLCAGFLFVLSYGSNSCDPTPVSWLLVCFVFWVNFSLSYEWKNSCGKLVSSKIFVWFVLWVKFMRSYLCVLGSCLDCFLGQTHAVPLLCPGFLSGWSCGSTSCGPTPVSWGLVWLVFWVNFMLIHCFFLSSFLSSLLSHGSNSCLVCLPGRMHAVLLLCPGFLCGLFFGSKSQGPAPVSWVLFCLVSWVTFMRLYCCVLGFVLLCLMGHLRAVILLCLGFLIVELYR